mgnify:CR=1 FL=1
MKRTMVLAGAMVLSLSVLAAAQAAPAAKAAAPPGKTAVRKESKGMQNARKVMQARFDQLKKTQDLKRKGIAKKEQELKK